MAAQRIAARLEQHAKEHHKWQRDTGMTDATTRGEIAEATRDHILIALSAGMDYDVFLELAKEGKWAWLWPTMVEMEGEIMQILRKELEGDLS